jgi:hypothetical protein
MMPAVPRRKSALIAASFLLQVNRRPPEYLPLSPGTLQIPNLMRSRTMARSNSAKTLIIWKRAFPPGIVVSHALLVEEQVRAIAVNVREEEPITKRGRHGA